MNDKTSFETIFTAFSVKFPPVQSLDQATLKLSTTEMTEMITDFWPEIQWPDGGISLFLIDQGYKYEPIEVNERVRYFWLIGGE